MPAENRRPQIHVTGISMFNFCGEQFRRRYILGEIIPPGVAMLVGTATDRAVTADLKSKIETKQLLVDEDIAAIARDALVAGWNGGVMLSEDEAAEGVRKVKGRAVDTSVRLAYLHHREIAPDIHPVAVQRSFALDLEGYPFQVVGTMDVQDDRGIRDTKTKSRSPGRDEAERSVQLTGYAMAVQALDGKLPERVTLDFLVDGKTPAAIVQESIRTPAHIAAFLRRLENAIKAIQAGIFVPAVARDPLCSPRFCGYWSSCKFQTGGK